MFKFNFSSFFTQRMRDLVDSSVAEENRRLHRKLELMSGDIRILKFNHEKEKRELQTDIEILNERLKVQDETVRLQQAALKGEYERRKAEIQAHIQHQQPADPRQRQGFGVQV